MQVRDNSVRVGECFNILISAVEFQKILQYYKKPHFWLPHTHGCSCSVLFANQYYAVVNELFKIFCLLLQNIEAVWYTISQTQVHSAPLSNLISHGTIILSDSLISTVNRLKAGQPWNYGFRPSKGKISSSAPKCLCQL